MRKQQNSVYRRNRTLLSKTFSLTSCSLLIYSSSTAQYVLAAPAHNVPRTQAPQRRANETRRGETGSRENVLGRETDLEVIRPGINDVRVVNIDGKPVKIKLEFVSLIGTNDRLMAMESEKSANQSDKSSVQAAMALKQQTTTPRVAKFGIVDSATEGGDGEQVRQVHVGQGSILLAHKQRVEAVTGCGSVHVPNDAAVYIMQIGGQVVVYNLCDGHNGDVELSIDDKVMRIRVGSEFVLSRNNDTSITGSTQIIRPDNGVNKGTFKGVTVMNVQYEPGPTLASLPQLGALPVSKQGRETLNRIWKMNAVLANLETASAPVEANSAKSVVTLDPNVTGNIPAEATAPLKIQVPRSTSPAQLNATQNAAETIPQKTGSAQTTPAAAASQSSNGNTPVVAEKPAITPDTKDNTKRKGNPHLDEFVAVKSSKSQSTVANGSQTNAAPSSTGQSIATTTIATGQGTISAQSAQGAQNQNQANQDQLTANQDIQNSQFKSAAIVLGQAGSLYNSIGETSMANQAYAGAGAAWTQRASGFTQAGYNYAAGVAEKNAAQAYTNAGDTVQANTALSASQSSFADANTQTKINIAWTSGAAGILGWQTVNGAIQAQPGVQGNPGGNAGNNGGNNGGDINGRAGTNDVFTRPAPNGDVPDVKAPDGGINPQASANWGRAGSNDQFNRPNPNGDAPDVKAPDGGINPQASSNWGRAGSNDAFIRPAYSDSIVKIEVPSSSTLLDDATGGGDGDDPLEDGEIPMELAKSNNHATGTNPTSSTPVTPPIFGFIPATNLIRMPKTSVCNKALAKINYKIAYDFAQSIQSTGDFSGYTLAYTMAHDSMPASNLYTLAAPPPSIAMYNTAVHKLYSDFYMCQTWSTKAQQAKQSIASIEQAQSSVTKQQGSVNSQIDNINNLISQYNSMPAMEQQRYSSVVASLQSKLGSLQTTLGSLNTQEDHNAKQLTTWQNISTNANKQGQYWAGQEQNQQGMVTALANILPTNYSPFVQNTSAPGTAPNITSPDSQ